MLTNCVNNFTRCIMLTQLIKLIVSLLGFSLMVWLPATADDGHAIPRDATFSTRITTPFAIEGLTGDNSGNFYTPGRNPAPGGACPVWRINAASPALVIVGFVPAPSPTGLCGPFGLTFNAAGDLFVSEVDMIYTFTPNAGSPPT